MNKVVKALLFLSLAVGYQGVRGCMEYHMPPPVSSCENRPAYQMQIRQQYSPGNMYEKTIGGKKNVK